MGSNVVLFENSVIITAFEVVSGSRLKNLGFGAMAQSLRSGAAYPWQLNVLWVCSLLQCADRPSQGSRSGLNSTDTDETPQMFDLTLTL